MSEREPIVHPRQGQKKSEKKVTLSGAKKAAILLLLLGSIISSFLVGQNQLGPSQEASQQRYDMDLVAAENGTAQMTPPASQEDTPSPLLSGATAQTWDEPVARVAYMLSITNCAPKFTAALYDAVAVWKHGIELHSFPRSKYAADFFVVMHPSLQKSKCSTVVTHSSSVVNVNRSRGAIGGTLQGQPSWLISTVADLNMTLLLKPFPILPDEIKNGTFLQRDIDKDGCCGHKELMKLYAYTMTNYTLAIHLDMDTLVTSPLDELFDAIHFPHTHPVGQAARQRLEDEKLIAPTHKGRRPLADVPDIAAFYTRDYNMLQPGFAKRVGMQGGFLLVRPNQTTYDELLDIVRSGDYTRGYGMKNGWRGSGFGGHIWGSLTIQGLLGYFFWTPERNTQNIELHRCKFNQISDNPRRSTFHRKVPRGTPYPEANMTFRDADCRDGRDNCDDVQCQTWPIEDTRLVHYTACKTPWTCPGLQYNATWSMVGCRAMHRAWFLVRQSLQKEMLSRYREAIGHTDSNDRDGVEIIVRNNSGTHNPELQFGYCNEKGPKGYITMFDHQLDLSVGFSIHAGMGKKSSRNVSSSLEK
eukprot:CAMPEP_0198113334 /NCGR_PEP_ID=MMETSP1442-20131203/5030_1 /TAXON_ID= /ORGANISM="Craspedostauros australis, Strain CCMP3328" /LENGTH=584 /DNA_ID=CAMNT_0043770397 /DNA_START=117 /DNA_END=1872 /DNA_ORIENTATION=+